MTLTLSKSKNATSFYATKCDYVNGKRKSRIVEKLGTESELRKKLDGQDPIHWEKRYVEELNRLEKEGNRTILVKYSPIELIPKDEKRIFSGGYLFFERFIMNWVLISFAMR